MYILKCSLKGRLTHVNHLLGSFPCFSSFLHSVFKHSSVHLTLYHTMSTLTLYQTATFDNQSKLEALADRNFIVAQMVEFIFNRIEMKTLWDTEEMLVKRIFSFANKVFKRFLSQGPCADPDIFLRGGPTENALVLLYDTLISGFQWV